MLILHRKKGKSLVIELPDGSLVRITVVDIRGDNVKLGVTAPRIIPVHRQEVFEAIERDRQGQPPQTT